jgi:hypothetical protein
MLIDENKAIVRSAFEALMTGNLTPLDDLLASDCVMHQCGFLEPIRGAEAIKHLLLSAASIMARIAAYAASGSIPPRYASLAVALQETT